MGFIYLVRNQINCRPYVGQTIKKKAEDRWKGHNKNSIGPYLLNAYNKYGRENFTYSVLCECPDEKLNEYEMAYIQLYSSMCTSLGGIGYNMTLGGLAGGKLSEEAKKKISDAHRGVPKSEESKKKLSETRRAMNWKPSPENVEKFREMNKTRVRTQEERDKISTAHKGKTISEEQRQKLRDFHTGLKPSDETKEKMRISQIGRTHSEETRQKISERNKGKTLTEERKAIIGEQKSKKVNQFTIEGVYIKTHSSIRAAGYEVKGDCSSISKCCNGRQQTAHGFKWTFNGDPLSAPEENQRKRKRISGAESDEEVPDYEELHSRKRRQ